MSDISRHIDSVRSYLHETTRNIGPADRRLARSRTDSWLGGVAGGVAETFGWNAGLVRLVFVASLVLLPLGGLPILLYLLAWFALPKRGDLS